MKFLIFIIMSALQISTVSSQTQKVLGLYSPEQLLALKVGCQATGVNSIMLVSENSKSCTAAHYIKNLKIHYPNGIHQEFNYTESSAGSAGAPLHVSQYKVLPGTKCLGQISAQIVKSKSRDCQTLSKIKVIVTL